MKSLRCAWISCPVLHYLSDNFIKKKKPSQNICELMPRFVTQVIDESIKIKTHAFLCNSLIILFFNNFFFRCRCISKLDKIRFLRNNTKGRILDIVVGRVTWRDDDRKPKPTPRRRSYCIFYLFLLIGS